MVRPRGKIIRQECLTFLTQMTSGKTDSSVSSIGQLLIVGFDGTEMTPRLSSLLTRLQPAGVILFARNIKSAEQTWQLLRDCQKCVPTPLFTCVDLEGGSVDRFRDVLGPAPSAADVFATGDRKLFRKHGQMIGENCRALGFNVDFAPSLDLAFEASRSVMSSRVVSAESARDSFLRARVSCRAACGKRARMRQAFSWPRRRQARQPSRTPCHRKALEEALDGRPGSLPNAPSAAAVRDDLPRGLSAGHKR